MPTGEIVTAFTSGIDLDNRTNTLAKVTLNSTYQTPAAAGTPQLQASVVPGVITRLILTLTDLSITVGNTNVGVGVKLADFDAGMFRRIGGRANLTFKTTSVLADTLNLSKTINWAVGTGAFVAGEYALVGNQSDLIPVKSAVSSATVNVVNTETVSVAGGGYVFGTAAAAADLYLNVGVPTANDIDADATVLVNGTIILDYEYLGAFSPTINYAAAPSPTIWQSCPFRDLQEGNLDGWAYFDHMLGDYTQAANVAAASTTLDPPWAAFTDATAGATIAPAISPTDAIGAMVLNSTTAQEGCIVSLFSALNLSCPVTLRGAAGGLTAATRFWMEARVKLEHTTTQYAAMYLGLIVVGRTITLGAIATGGAAMAAVDGIGIMKVAADTTAIGSYQSNGTATAIDATGGVIVANTYVNLGMVWDGAVMTFYQDGAAWETTSALASTQFPAGAALMPVWQMICGSDGTTTSASMDWIKVAFKAQ